VKSKEDIKSQAGKFVRNLVLFASSLDELPQENWITIEIKVGSSYASGMRTHRYILTWPC
jgi:hypothetical protein